jgi:ADP-ribose pyrophosphatase
MDYLDELPRDLAYLGDSSSGEIEITDCLASDSECGVIARDDFIMVIRDAVRFPDAEIGTYVRIIEIPQLSGTVGSVIVPVWEGRVLLVSVFRHATRSWSIEFPRGFSEAGESGVDTATREALEETGVVIEEATRLGSIHPNAALLASRVEVFSARVRPEESSAIQGGERRLVTREAIGVVVPHSPDEVDELIATGAITDAISISAWGLFRLSRKEGGRVPTDG